MRNFIRLLFFLIVLAGFASSRSQAQVGTTSLRGNVTDSSGAVVVGAKITLDNAGQGFHRESASGSVGQYEFLALPPGSYTLVVEAPGFRRFEQTNLELLVNNPATVNVHLQVGSDRQTVEVSAQSETLNTTDASIGIAFNENQIKQLPLEGRNVPDLLSLQPGVLYTGNRPDVDTNYDTRNGSVNGSRSDQTNVTLDGVSVNPKGGYAFQSILPVTLDSVEEFRVTTTNYNSDEGGTGGAQVALVTKSGTNDFHGSAYEYNRNTATSANDFFVKNAQLNSGQPNLPPKLIRNIFGGSIGGPIRKDRLFLFLNYEGTRRSEQQSSLVTVPTQSMRDGVIQYQCDTTDPNLATDCPGGTITVPTTDPKRPGAMDTIAVPQGYYALTPQQITALDPLHIGPNAAMIAYMNTFPLPNDVTVGDLVNTGGFRFRGPISNVKNWYIAKLDYNITQDGRQRFSLSGALANENLKNAPFLPGQPPETQVVNYNKGIIANYSWAITSNFQNNLRYGFVRESVGTIGNSGQDWILVAGAFSQGIARSSAFQRPIHNIYEDASWTRGRHTFQFGGQMAFIRNPEFNQNNSFSDGSTNPAWTDTGGYSLATNSPLNPINYVNPTTGQPQPLPAVDSGSTNNYDFPLSALLGVVPEVDAYYNYTRKGTVLPDGGAVTRRYAEDSYEMYFQDVWKATPGLTLTLGLRYSLFSPPWETNGLEITPTIPLAKWFNQRGQDMLQGIPSSQDPVISYDWSGPANGKPGYYSWNTHDFSPRLAAAWQPRYDHGLLKSLFGDGKSAVRAGFSIVYDRLGETLIDDFDQNGAYGVSTTLSNQQGSESVLTAPRVTDIHTIPTMDQTGTVIFPSAPAANYPAAFPSGLFSVQAGIDSHLKTPYAYTFDLSFSRELGHNFSVDAAYVGRLSRRLLSPEDLAQPLDIFDKKSGLDYFKAITALAKIYRSGVPTNQFNPASLPQNVQQYFQDMVQPLQPGDQYSVGLCVSPNSSMTATSSPVVAIYDQFCGFSLNEVQALQNWDTRGLPSTLGNSYYPTTGPYTFENPQFASLFAWRSITNASYNALELTLRHAMANGVQFDFNYTFSKSIDISSDAQRVGTIGGGLGGAITNAWTPDAGRGLSDYDATHQFNSNWILELPFGKGKAIGRNSSKGLDAFIGGWQLSGLFRLTSGFPVNVNNGARYPTNWQLSVNSFLTGPVTTGAFTITSGADAGAVNIFKNGPDAVSSYTSPFPGQVGARNQIRGDGYFGVDLGLAKRWAMPWKEGHSLQFRWEVFNVTNSVRFDVQTTNTYTDIGNTFGNYTSLISNPRVMQFALRYEF